MSEKILRIVEDQIEAENDIIEKAEESVAKATNPIVKSLLRGVQLDSMKHKEFLEAALSLLRGETYPVTNVRDLREAIEAHASLEADSINRLEEMMAESQNDHATRLFAYILGDERRHHSFFRVLSTLEVLPTIPDQLWAMIDDGVGGS